MINLSIWKWFHITLPMLLDFHYDRQTVGHHFVKSWQTFLISFTYIYQYFRTSPLILLTHTPAFLRHSRFDLKTVLGGRLLTMLPFCWLYMSIYLSLSLLYFHSLVPCAQIISMYFSLFLLLHFHLHFSTLRNMLSYKLDD